MKLTVRGKNIEATDAIRASAEKKLSVLSKYFPDEELTVKVLIRTYPSGQKVEVTVIGKRFQMRAEDTDRSLYDAIDAAVSKLERQIRKYKTRKNKISRQSVRNGEAPAVADSDDVIVRRKRVDPKPMDFEEAIMQMELSDHKFYVFNDRETGLVSVVYKRDNGGYGILETSNLIF